MSKTGCVSRYRQKCKESEVLTAKRFEILFLKNEEKDLQFSMPEEEYHKNGNTDDQDDNHCDSNDHTDVCTTVVVAFLRLK